MDEITREPNKNFQIVQNDISKLLKLIAVYLRERQS
jgi:hypothetical protein